MLWQGKLSTRSCKSLQQGSGTILFLQRLSPLQRAQGTELLPRFHSRPQRGADEIQALESIPLLSMETKAANTVRSINRQCGGALGYTLLPGVRNHTQSHHLGTDQGTDTGTNN